MTQQFSTQYFSKSGDFNDVRPNGLSSVILMDTDLIRGNSEDEFARVPPTPTSTFVFELFNGFTGFQSSDTGEASLRVTFKDGTTLSGVEGLFDQTFFSFLFTSQQFLLDLDALAAVGKTMADVADVTVEALIDHDLNWSDFGFTPTGITLPEPEPQPEPEPEPVLNVINGTTGNDRVGGTRDADQINGLDGDDRLVGRNGDDVLEGGNGNDTVLGGNGDDVLVGGADNDRLIGGAGADTFVFGAQAGDGDRDRDVITDFNVDEDSIVFEAGAVIRFVEQRGDHFFIQLEGDRDSIVVRNADIGAATTFVFADDVFLA